MRLNRVVLEGLLACALLRCGPGTIAGAPDRKQNAEASLAGGSAGLFDGSAGDRGAGLFDGSAGDRGGSAGAGGSDPFAAARQACVDQVNELRATVGLGPYERWTANEPCADAQAASDGRTGDAHGAFDDCPNLGQNECPGWSSIEEISDCLDAMWAEGPGGGHYDIMTSTSYTQLSCGFYVTSTGEVWAVQDFK